MKKVFLNARIFTGKEMLTGKTLVIEGEKIQAVTANEQLTENPDFIDCSGLIIAPGFIDLQIYGAGGYLFSNDPTPASLRAVADAILNSGTTGFYLTLATNSMEIFSKAITVVKENPHPAVLGLHFEGPYLNPVKRGAHIKEYIKKAEKKEVEKLLKEAGGVLKIVTLAPELCDPEIIKLFRDNGVVVSAGHSNATFKEAVKGYENGVTTTTHLFNAMSSMHHRDTGLPGAAFLSGKAYASIIADGIHVDFNTLKISKKLMGDRLFLITDAVAPVSEGPYQHVEKEDRYTLPDGTLSGSKLTLLKAVQNCVEQVQIPLGEAIRMASTYPAKVMSLANRGKIEPGCEADLTIFSEDYQIKYSVLKGKVFESK